MKKLALLSVHNDPNYGSALQAYALAYAIRREGRDCEYLNYTSVLAPTSIKAKAKQLVKSLFYKLGLLDRSRSEYSYWETEAFAKQRQLFLDFHEKRIPYSETLYDPTTIITANAQYDGFVVGSDQTWSPYVTRQKNNIYFLDFVQKGKLKGSYAPSLGTCQLSEEYVKILEKKLSSFRYLSCREKQNADYLSKRFSRKVEHVLDPTLLVSRKEWLEVAEPLTMPEDYVLCYILGKKQSISDFAEELGRSKSLPVYYIVSRPEYLVKNNALRNISPGQFITLISNASYVVTDSFHGCLFSFIFQRQFYAFTKRTMADGEVDNDRIKDVLSFLKIKDRLKEDTSFQISNNIDYSSLEETFSSLYSISIDYLRELLK